MSTTRLAIALGTVLSVAAAARGSPVIAYQVNAPSNGNYDWLDPLGLDFDVNSPIYVTRVGVFDSDQNGLMRAITFYLYDRQTGQPVIGPLVFEGDAGTLAGGNRLVDVPDVRLPAGFQGTVVGENYGPGESYYDIGAPPGAGGAGASVTNEGGGLISFVGLGRFGGDANGGNRGQFPREIDVGPANRYSTGTFEFDVIPEPAFASLLGASAGLFLLRRRR